MKKITLILLLFASIAQYSSAQTIKYGIFATSKFSFKTNKVVEQPRQFFIDAILTGNNLKFGNDISFSLYNKKEEVDGFDKTTTFDGIDNKNQRCKIVITYRAMNETSLKTTIMIAYENSEFAYIYNSRDPE